MNKKRNKLLSKKMPLLKLRKILKLQRPSRLLNQRSLALKLLSELLRKPLRLMQLPRKLSLTKRLLKMFKQPSLKLRLKLTRW